MNVRRYHVFLYVGLWLLIGAGVYGASYCYDQHICRDGHMAHPEMKTYWPREYAIDALWSGCLLTVRNTAAPADTSHATGAPNKRSRR